MAAMMGAAPAAAPGGYSRKTLLNNVLDSLTLPVVWITNTPADALNPSNCRRFDYSIEFPRLSGAQRLQIWRNAIEAHGLQALFDDDGLAFLAARYEASAGGISIALKNLANLAPTREEALPLAGRLLNQHCRLLQSGARSRDRMEPARDYSLDGLNIRTGCVPLPRIIASARRFLELRRANAVTPDSPRMSILLTGAPGSGKTEFVKHLGKILGVKILVRMGSDILGKYVGETEKRIAEAFRAAEQDGSILFMDEIDGLFQGRERATHNWEVTQVNELLHQMEHFDGMFVGATNFTDNLDGASLRRFTFKIEFDYLDAAGKRAFFNRFFPDPLSDTETARRLDIPMLTPGDFRTVRQSLFYLGGDVSNDDRLAALEKESEDKKRTHFARAGKHIGFAT